MPQAPLPSDAAAVEGNNRVFVAKTPIRMDTTIPRVLKNTKARLQVHEGSSCKQTIPLSHTASFIKKQASRLICLTDSPPNTLCANAYF